MLPHTAYICAAIRHTRVCVRMRKHRLAVQGSGVQERYKALYCSILYYYNRVCMYTYRARADEASHLIDKNDVVMNVARPHIHAHLTITDTV